ncbi:uncharacterized protein LOC110435590 [Sorghum bicolor]|uniref:uncharacterized protein LOC110435590 n=1 Tax=Sorghum bicolor TaxID=4558 RepID=UPI00081AEAE7|nr:uncharacterized protein LOC110435590 [Sorghum bicolor]|eukprot:XP_021316960.1 uncharacterized protein LOC110435590 [Sorghum bicolor]
MAWVWAPAERARHAGGIVTGMPPAAQASLESNKRERRGDKKRLERRWWCVTCDLMPQPSTAPLPVVDAPPSSGVDGRSSSPEVILDSGAAMHVTGCGELLSGPTTRPAPQGSRSFRTRGGEVMDAVAVGSVATRRFLVHQVYQVPGLPLGRGQRAVVVLSVRQLTRLGLAVTFGCEACDVRDRGTGALVGEGHLREEDGFYYLDYLRVPLP